MNFKKHILLLLATLLFSVPSLAEKNVFLGKGVEVVSGAGDVFRGITKSDFIETVGDFASGANAQIADQAWD